MKRIHRSIRDWARQRNVAHIRYGVVVLLALVGVVWAIGSYGFDSWQHCDTRQVGQKVERACSPVSLRDLGPLLVLTGIIMWPELEQLTVGVFSFTRRRAGRDADKAPEDPAGPEADFRDAWAHLYPWSRLASRLASAEFQEQLSAASPQPGTVKVGRLGRDDRPLIRDLELGSSFTVASAAAWSERSRTVLDSLSRTADRSQQVSDEQFADGADAAARLLSELRELGLRP